MSLSSYQRLELILTYYILWKMKREPRILKQYVRHYITNRVKAFAGSDLAVASIADLGTKDHDLLDGLLDDDHTMYYHTDGTDSVTGDITTTGNRRDDIGGVGAYFDNLYIDKVFGNDTADFPTGQFTSFLGKSAISAFQTRALDNARIGFWARDNDTDVMTECARLASLSEPEFRIDRAGDISHLDGKFTIFDKASGNGIKVDTATPTFGWRDLLGEIRTRGVGATDPNDAVYDGANIRAFQFAVNDECWIDYHIPHDYEAGTDIHLHFHWSHNGTLVTGGNVTWGADVTYAKGHNQAAFPASVNPTVVGTASTTQYQHIITEVQISASAPGATEIDSDDLEPDGVIMIRAYLSANNITVSGGAVPDPFLHYVDVHYQSTNIATKAKVPDFYT